MKKSNIPKIPLGWEKFKSRSVKLSIFEFGEKEKKWKKFLVGDEIFSKEVEKLTLLTLNTWFSDRYFSERFFSQIFLFKELKPDVICLQEVRHKYMHLMKENTFIRENYLVSDNPDKPSTFYQYGCIMLVKKTFSQCIRKMNKLILPSKMSRDLIYCNLDLINNKKNSSFIFNIGTIHLESLSNWQLRRMQLRLIAEKVQNKKDNCLLCGDFNFDDERNYNRNVLPLENDFLTKTGGVWTKYIDVYDKLKPTEKKQGKTFDNQKNKMIFKNNYIEQMRYDRIMLKSKDLIPKTIKIVGDEPIKENSIIFPSDHFGLFTELECTE